jgi:hypothetical protein
VPLTSPLAAARLDLGAQIAASRALLQELDDDAVASADGAAAFAPSDPIPAPAPPPPPPEARPAPQPARAARRDAAADAVADVADELDAEEIPPQDAGPVGSVTSVAGSERRAEAEEVAAPAESAPPGSTGAPAPKSSGSTTARVALSGTPEVRGELDAAVVQAALRRLVGQLKVCYETSLKATPTASGVMVFDLSIGTDGRVTAARLVRSTVDDRALPPCMIATMKKWSFPKDYGGASGATFTVQLSP